MSAKKFIKALVSKITEDVTAVPALEDLQESFQTAVDNLPKGKLRKSLRTDFNKHLETLHRKISKKLESGVPTLFQPENEDELSSELSVLDTRHGVRDLASPQQQKPVYSLIGKIRPPDFNKHENFTIDQKQHILGTYIRGVLCREDVDDDTILDLLHQLEHLSEKTDSDDDSKSKFQWHQRMDMLFKLSTGLDGKPLIRVLQILFREITTDVENIIEKGKSTRAGRMSEILHKYLTSSHMTKTFLTLQEEDKKPYGDLMAALLAFYVDLRLVHASKVSKKKAEGRQLCGFVSYILKEYPESLLEVILQLYGPVEENNEIMLPLIGKSLSIEPKKNSHYLKYILVVKTMTDKLGQDEMIDFILKTRALRCNKDFLDWLDELCPEALEEMPTNDKKFKGRKVTKFLLDEADDNMITLLMDSLRNSEENLQVSTEDDSLQKVLNILTGKEEEMPDDDQLFFIDKGGSESNIDDKRKEENGAKESEHKILVLKTQKEIEDILDVTETKPFKIGSDILKRDISDEEFFSSEIVSIKTLQPSAEGADESGAPTVSNEEIEDKHNENKDMDETHDNMESEKITPSKESKDKKTLKSSGKNGMEKCDPESGNQEKSNGSVTFIPEIVSHLDKSKKNAKSPRQLKSVVVKPNSIQNKQKETQLSLPVNEDDYNILESTTDCEDNSLTSSREVLVDTESFDVSKSDLSRSDVFSTEGEVTVVHLGEGRNVIADTTTDDETICNNISVDKTVIDESKSKKNRKKKKKRNQSHSSESEDVITNVKGRRHSKTSSSSFTSQDTSQEESQLNKTEKYVDGFPYKSPYNNNKTASKLTTSDDGDYESETIVSDLSKTESQKTKYKEYDEAAQMAKASASPTVSYEAKFIARALKKRTPKKENQETCINKSSEKNKKKSKGSSEDTDTGTNSLSAFEAKRDKWHKSGSASDEGKVDKCSVSSPEVQKGVVENANALGTGENGDQSENIIEEEITSEEDATKEKTGRLTPQKMLEILNDVRHMTDVTAAEVEPKEEKLNNEESEDLDSCIEIASESQSESEFENELGKIFPAKKTECLKHDDKKQQKANSEINMIEESSKNIQAAYLREKDNSYIKSSEENIAETDKNDSTVSVIDLVSECEEKENEIALEKSVASHSLLPIKSPETVKASPKLKSSQVKSPKLVFDKTESAHKEDKSPLKASAEKSPFHKKHNHKSPKNRPSLENDAVTNDTSVTSSPRQKPAASNVKKKSPETLTTDSSSAISADIIHKTPKAKTPMKSHSSPPRKSPRLSSAETGDNEVYESEDKETQPSAKKHKQKSPSCPTNLTPKNSDVIPKIPSTETTPIEKKYSLRSPSVKKLSESESADMKIPSSQQKIFKSHTSSTELQGNGRKLYESESESDMESIPNLSQHLKSPHIPILSDNLDKESSNDRLKLKSPLSEAETDKHSKSQRQNLPSPDKDDINEQRRSPRKLGQSLSKEVELHEDEPNNAPDKTDSSKTREDKIYRDVYEFHSETDQSDREDRKSKTSPQTLKLDTGSAETMVKKSSRRKSAGQEDEECDKAGKTIKISPVAKGEGTTGGNDLSTEPCLKSLSPKSKATRRRTVEKKDISKQMSPKENVSKEKLGLKRKSVSYAFVEEGSETEEVDVKKSTPPKRRSERKVSASTSKKPAVKRVEESRRSLRKRRLSSELSRSESESVFETEDSDVTFPKVKKAEAKPAGTRTSKRVSMQAVTKKNTSEEPESGKGTKQRYSLRKK